MKGFLITSGKQVQKDCQSQAVWGARIILGSPNSLPLGSWALRTPSWSLSDLGGQNEVTFRRPPWSLKNLLHTFRLLFSSLLQGFRTRLWNHRSWPNQGLNYTGLSHRVQKGKPVRSEKPRAKAEKAILQESGQKPHLSLKIFRTIPNNVQTFFD